VSQWIKFFGGFLLCCCPFQALHAWNAEGHMVVAQIAYNHLNPVAKARCDALIAISLTNSSAGTSSFVTAACWADDFKTPLGTGIWHYIDLPISLDGTSTSGVAADSFDVVKAINLCITNLQSATVAQSNKAVCLRYLIHFVGDIQQPLHCSTGVSASHPAGDAGGNSFSITGPSWSNLHSLWDAGGGFLVDFLTRPLSIANQNTLAAKVALIEADYPYNYGTNPGNIPDPMAWAQEGKNLAATVSYVGVTQNASPSTAYLNTAMATTEQRLATGGHRLADLLNTLFQPLALTAVTRTNGNFSFSWGTVSNSTYTVQWKTNLTDATWNNLTNLTATAGSISFTDKVAQVRRFYRVSQ
jgi:hypothetical protein